MYIYMYIYQYGGLCAVCIRIALHPVREAVGALHAVLDAVGGMRLCGITLVLRAGECSRTGVPMQCVHIYASW